jgi:hypothetical protein
MNAIKKFRQSLLILVLAIICTRVAWGQFIMNEFNSRPTRMIAGAVSDPNGAPAVGAMVVTLPSQDTTTPPVLTDTNGKYWLLWPPLAANPRSTMIQSVIARDLKRNLVATHLIDEKTTNVDLHLQPGLTILFKVEDPAGNPIPNAAAWLSAYYANASLIIPNQSREDNAKEPSVFEYKALPRGFHYSGGVQAGGYGVATLQFPADTQTNRIDLGVVTLKPANLKVAGRVIFNPDEQAPIPVMVIMSGAGQPNSGIQSDADGHFAFNVCDGPVTLTVTMYIQGGGTRYLRGEVTTTGGNTNVEIKLAPVDVLPPAPAAPINRTWQQMPPGG